MSDVDWYSLGKIAWDVRECGIIFGKTRVGAALVSSSGAFYAGCNVEQRYRNGDVHAEVNAITTMVSNGEGHFIAMMVAAERDRFTPCGTCLDWIFQFGGSDCLVGIQRSRDEPVTIFKVRELMPFYPY